MDKIIGFIILAGVSIAMLTGNNGILTQAQNAKNKTEQAEENEQNILNNYEDKINEYAGIDWDTVLANAKKHPEQKASTAIGVGTDGKAVNMDLWEYTLLEDGTYILLSVNSLNAVENKLWSDVDSGYKGNYDTEGKISGSIPNYISTNDGNNYIPVTSISNLFRNCTELKIAPRLPSTVTDISNTFNNTNIIEAPKIPNSVTNMQYTFQGCTRLKKVSNLSNNLENMNNTFQDCVSLLNAPEIPNGVQNMSGTFDGCINLETPPSLIPSSVTDIRRTFKNCYKLSGTIKIEANITGQIIDNEIDCKYSFSLEEPTKNDTNITLTGDSTVLNLIIDNSFNHTIHI